MTDDAITTEVLEWQTRPLCCQYLVVLFDTLHVQVQEEGTMRDKAIHLALGMLEDGEHEVLGLWIDPAPGAKGWRKVFKQLMDRGVERIRFAGVDGPKGLPAAIRATYPATNVQPSIAHLVRRSLSEVAPRDRKPVAAALRPTHTAAGAVAARAALDALAAGQWDAKYPSIVRRWQAESNRLIPFFASPRKVRRTILLADHAIDHLHLRLSREIGKQGCIAGDQAATAFVWLALHRVLRRWSHSAQAQHLTENPRPARNASGRVTPARTLRAA